MPSIRTCPVCGQQRTRVLFRPKASPGPVAKCHQCGMVYVESIADDRALIFDGPVNYGQPDPKILTSSDLADVRDSWELKLLPDKEVEWPALRENAIAALQRIDLHMSGARSERRILDFGSGWGFFLAVAKERGWATFGLEPLPASAVYARATFGLNIVTDTLRENTFPPDSFDVITSFQVFEHVPSPQKDIAHLSRMLRTDGLLLIEVPNVDTWTMRIMQSKHRHFVQDHLNFFSVDTLGRLLVDHGFEVVASYCPKRRMSIRHLVRHWAHRYLPAPVSETLQRSLQRTRLWQQTIGINIGDIIAVVGRKRR